MHKANEEGCRVFLTFGSKNRGKRKQCFFCEFFFSPGKLAEFRSLSVVEWNVWEVKTEQTSFASDKVSTSLPLASHYCYETSPNGAKFEGPFLPPSNSPLSCSDNTSSTVRKLVPSTAESSPTLESNNGSSSWEM